MAHAATLARGPAAADWLHLWLGAPDGDVARCCWAGGAHLRCRPLCPRTAAGPRAQMRCRKCRARSPAPQRPPPAHATAQRRQPGEQAWVAESRGSSSAAGAPGWRLNPRPGRRRHPAGPPDPAPPAAREGRRQRQVSAVRACWRSHMRQSTTWQRERCSANARRSSGAGENLTLRQACSGAEMLSTRQVESVQVQAGGRRQEWGFGG